MNGTAVKEARKRTIVIITAAGVALAAFALLLIFPAQYRIAGMKKDIVAMQSLKENKHAMYPVYSTLVSTDKQLSAMLAELKTPADAPALPKTGIKTLPAAFKEIAGAAGLNLDACVPDIRSIEQGDPDFHLDLTLNGPFIHLPRLLSILESEQRIQGVNKLEITSGPQLTYQINLLISMTAPENGKLET